EDGRPRRERAPGAADIPQLLQGQQEPPGGGPGEPGALGDLRQRQRGVLRREAADHGQAAVQRLDEVRAPPAGGTVGVRAPAVAQRRTGLAVPGPARFAAAGPVGFVINDRHGFLPGAARAGPGAGVVPTVHIANDTASAAHAATRPGLVTALASGGSLGAGLADLAEE